MDGILDSNRSAWRSVLATFLWVIVAVAGLSLVQALQPILFALGRLTLSGDVTGVVMDKYRIVSVRHWGLIVYGMVWLGGIILLNTYFSNARSTSQLLKRFGLWILGIAGVWGLSFLAQAVAMS